MVMDGYATELQAAMAEGTSAYETISEWLDRPFDNAEPVPTAELEKQVKRLRASRLRLLSLQKANADAPDIAAALEANAALYRKIGVTLPEDT